MKRYLVGSLFFILPSCMFFFCLGQKENHLITFVNDIPELINNFPEETKELQESIEYTVEVNGVSIKPDETKDISVYDNCCIISVKSKKSFHEHLDFVSARARKIIGWFTSWIDIYYSFVCIVPTGTDMINVAPLVVHTCQSLKAKKSFRISYKRLFGIQIWLRD